MLHVIGGRDSQNLPDDANVINTTSRSHSWSVNLSPFFLGPVELYDGKTAKNMENAWQYSKVYSKFVDDKNTPTSEYFKWADEGWCENRAMRYPMGKGAVPLYSYWNGEHLDYINARKKIYIPLYVNAIIKTEAFERLRDLHQSEKDIYLWDFDGYNHHSRGMSLTEVINSPRHKMGHAFVLAMILEYGETFDVNNMHRKIDISNIHDDQDQQFTLF